MHMSYSTFDISEIRKEEAKLEREAILKLFASQKFPITTKDHVFLVARIMGGEHRK